MQSILEKTENLLRLRGYSPKTRKSYLFYISEYLEFSKKENIKDKNKATRKLLLEEAEK